jgi:hypothetical protein
MSNTSPHRAQVHTQTDPTNLAGAAKLAADLDRLDKLRDCVNRGLCLIPEYGVIFDHPDAGVVRCACGKSDCTGKHPSIKWKGVIAPPTFSQVEDWYYKTPPMPVMSNWAVLLGACDPPLAVLDIDTRNGGLESFAALEAKHGPLPQTWQDASSRGGGHYYFVAPPGLPEKAKVELGPGLDFLIGRHLVVIDPSIHWTGANYRWIVPPWGPTPVADLPPFLRDLANSCSTPKRKSAGASVLADHKTGKRSRPVGNSATDTITAEETEVVRQALACVPGPRPTGGPRRRGA